MVLYFRGRSPVSKTSGAGGVVMMFQGQEAALEEGEGGWGRTQLPRKSLLCLGQRCRKTLLCEERPTGLRGTWL